MPRLIETAAVILIALVILVFGRQLLLNISQFHGVAAIVLGALGVLQLATIRTRYAEGGQLARIRATRDVIFVVAIGMAIAFVLSPQRWSLEATVTALEFGLVVELFARFTPAAPSAP
jgi:hypothetical protein